MDLDRTFTIDYGQFAGLLNTKTSWTLRELKEEQRGRIAEKAN